MVKGTTKGPKERCWSGDGQERRKKWKNRCFLEYVGRVMVKSVKKRRFFGICWSGGGQGR